MSNSNEGEGNKELNLSSATPPAQKPMTEAERMRQQKIQQKQALAELADYKKRLRASNELKQMQTDELRLGVEYYKYKVEFRELKPKMDELDAIEEAEAAEEKARQKKEYDAYIEKQKELEKKKEEKPDIIVPKTGKPRE